MGIGYGRDRDSQRECRGRQRERHIGKGRDRDRLSSDRGRLRDRHIGKERGMDRLRRGRNRQRERLSFQNDFLSASPLPYPTPVSVYI